MLWFKKIGRRVSCGAAHKVCLPEVGLYLRKMKVMLLKIFHVITQSSVVYSILHISRSTKRNHSNLCVAQLKRSNRNVNSSKTLFTLRKKSTRKPSLEKRPDISSVCILGLCLAFCVLLGANMATNVGHPHALSGAQRYKCWVLLFLGPKKTTCLANESFILFTYLFKSKTHLNFTKIQLIAK